MDDDIERVEPTPGAPALIRRGQVLTDASGTAAVARWAVAVVEADGIHRVRLSPGVDVCELVATLRDRGVRASPNHVMTGQPLFFGGPASRPFPIDALPVPEEGETGADRVTVALADTGLAAHPWWREKPWFTGREHDGAEVPDGDGDGELDPQAGHGTFIAGLIMRSAPGVRIRPVRVLDGRGVGDEAGLLRVLGRLRDDPPQVLNLSFGGHTFDDLPSPLVETALAELAGTVTVACAGNTASQRPFWPAACPRVIAVGALDAAERARAPFSAYGPWVDACARGEWLPSTFLDHGAFHGYARWSGTSFAAAVVSGAVAAAARNLSPGEAAARVLAREGGRLIPDLGVAIPTSG
ncbi:subtilisin family serine protease [Streptosporangium becharense]|uniref:Subtilisin family serine protease n=1 Tax=Streptosporangium becharense TaxID=1816182 RepID=A0A7W9IK52_9ACTN|nr:S8/S53 family peptidase [Streptosporangium becharense]MBB2913227.1 subtilisin family serine protease [Streptosporangium becharense]MBB5822210.1 subtilisin family serine protease [Streptosporangium becharense]